MVRTIGRGGWFLVRAVCAVIVMAAVGVAQAPALLWYAVVASPECDGSRTDAQMLTAQIGMVSVGAASAALAVVLGVAFLRLRWGWLIWWVVPVLALAAPIVGVYLLPVASPGDGGVLCH